MNRLPTALPSRTNRAIIFLRKLLFYKPPELPTTLAIHKRVAATNRTNIDQNDNHQKETTIMTETNELDKLEERNGLYHLTVDGQRYVFTKSMLTGGQLQLVPMENIEGLHRFFDGRLNCWPAGYATWLDGEKETRVEVVTRADRYPEFVTDGGFIQVPDSMVRAWPADLGWIADAGYELGPGALLSTMEREELARVENGKNFYYRANPFLRRFFPLEELPPVYFVPNEDWKQRMAEVVGITWKSDDEIAILSKARGLGYKDPERAKPIVSKPSQPAVSLPDQHAHMAAQFS